MTPPPIHSILIIIIWWSGMWHYWCIFSFHIKYRLLSLSQPSSFYCHSIIVNLLLFITSKDEINNWNEDGVNIRWHPLHKLLLHATTVLTRWTRASKKKTTFFYFLFFSITQNLGLKLRRTVFSCARWPFFRFFFNIAIKTSLNSHLTLSNGVGNSFGLNSTALPDGFLKNAT